MCMHTCFLFLLSAEVGNDFVCVEQVIPITYLFVCGFWILIPLLPPFAS